MKAQVPEQKLVQAAVLWTQVTGSTGINKYDLALIKGREFKNAGLSPFYIFDDTAQDLFVTSLEQMENRLN